MAISFTQLYIPNKSRNKYGDYPNQYSGTTSNSTAGAGGTGSGGSSNYLRAWTTSTGDTAGTWTIEGISDLESLFNGLSIKVKFSTGPAEATQLNTLDIGIVSEDTAVTSTTKVVFLENGEPLVVGENVPADSYIKAGDEFFLTYRLEAGYVEGELVDGWVMERANDVYARELFTLTGDTANTFIQANENFYSVKEVSAHGTGGTQSSIQSVVDNLETDSQTDALSARQGMLLYSGLTGKQDTIIFTGNNATLKTINGQSLQGPGNLIIQGGEGTGGTYYYEGSGITISTANTISISEPTWQLIDNKYDKTGGTVSGSVIALEEVSAYGTGGTQSSIQSVIDNLSSPSQTDALSANQGRVLDGKKQDTLVSGVNIKTINNESILGEGNINIQGGGGTGGTSYNAGTGITISSDTISISDSTWGIINNKYDKTGGTVYGSVFAEQEVSAYGTGGSQSSILSVINNLNGSTNVYDALSAIQGKVLDDKISDKQDKLYDSGSNQNIKTINNQSILGSGNITIQGEGGGTTYNAGTGITITSDTISISDATWGLIGDKYDKTGGTVSGSVIALQEVSAYGTGGTGLLISSVVDNLNSNSGTDALSANQGRVLNNKFSTKQDKIVFTGSNATLKTINGYSLEGPGNITIQGGGGTGGSEYYAGANIGIVDYVISVTGITDGNHPSMTAGTAINATKLDNHPSDYFVNTATTQTISGVKTFNENIIGMKDISAYGSGGTQSQIQYVENTLTATSIYNALSANQGRVLNNLITGLTASKQDVLISGTNIKTINNESILGSGNITIQGGGDATYATYLGNASSNYSKSTLDTALAGKLGTGATAADSSKLGGVAASSYAQTNGTYNNMTVGRATTWDGYKLAIVSSIPSSPRTDTIYFGY